jgi:hypothetical protein
MPTAVAAVPPLYTRALVFGMIWASRPGALLSWDPKEVWSLITWLFHHFTFTPGWSWAGKEESSTYRHHRFSAALITFFGVITCCPAPQLCLINN